MKYNKDSKKLEYYQLEDLSDENEKVVTDEIDDDIEEEDLASSSPEDSDDAITRGSYIRKR